MSGNQQKITPAYIVDLLLRRRWTVLIPFCLVVIGGIFFSIFAPRNYEAKTLILVEGQRVPQNYVQSIVSEDTSARIDTISQQILSRTNLEKIVNDFSLFASPDDSDMYMEDKVTTLRKNIAVDVITDQRRRTDAFEITYKGKDPHKVMQIVNALAASFIDENLRVRESQAIGTSSFLEAEMETGRVRLERLEEKIKDYRKANMGELPEQLETNLRILERMQASMSDRRQSLREAKFSLAELKNQARAKNPSVVVIGNDNRPQEGGATLEELIDELKTLQSRYTERHPDIIRLKKQIAEAESASLSKGGSSTPVRTRMSPALRAQIAEVQGEIQGAVIEIQELEAQIASFEQRIENTPKREQEILGLKRDYQNIQASYDSLLNRKLEADIAVNMERQQKGEQFRIVDSAKLPQRPVEPDMRKVFLLVVAAGLGLGGGMAYAREKMDTSLKDPDEVEAYFELPVLTAIPHFFDTRDLFLRKINNFGAITFALVNVCLVGLFGLVSLKGADVLGSILKSVTGS